MPQAAITVRRTVEEIYKVKEPGEPVQTFTGRKLKKADPILFEQAKHLKRGQKRVLKIREKRTTFRVGVHKLHPRELSVRARERVCGAGLRGEARRLFIEEGKTLEEQISEGRLRAELERAAAIREYYAEHPEEFQYKQSRRLKRKAKRIKQKEESTGKKVIDISGLITPADIAEEAEVTPLDVRKFLRAKNIGKRGGRYAFTEKEAARIVRAVRKHYEED
jgi:hypothetical protein